MRNKAERDDFAARAERAYEERWKSILEPDHLGELIAVEPDSGDYVLAKDLWDLDKVCEQKFGRKLVYVFRVGGGAAVKIRGPIRYAPLSGRA